MAISLDFTVSTYVTLAKWGALGGIGIIERWNRTQWEYAIVFTTTDGGVRYEWPILAREFKHFYRKAEWITHPYANADLIRSSTPPGSVE